MQNKIKQKTILAVFAHPDDESFGMGGTLAYYARQGVDVYLVCATRGEAGEVDKSYLENDTDIAALREHELRCAAEKLGIREVFFLNYRDSGMQGSTDNEHPLALVNQPTALVATKVAEYITKLQPQVVVTFDPIGGYRHPDHIAIQKATVMAFDQVLNRSDVENDGEHYQPEKLYFHTMPRGLMRFGVRLLKLIGRDPRKMGKNGDIDLVSITEVKFPTHARVNYRAVADLKKEASQCHSSQGGQQMSGGIMGWLSGLFGSRDTFMRAFPEFKKGEKIAQDLFQ